jgi:rhodanese-related sulfurtransferase
MFEVMLGLMILTVATPVTELAHPATPQSPDVQFMTADQLKSKLGKSQKVTIIDVRTTETFASTDRKIKGAIHVKLRRLSYRLSFAPLNSVPRDSEVVTYCACPNDELSIKAAQILTASGFKRVWALKGGWREWLRLNGQVEAVSKGD